MIFVSKNETGLKKIDWIQSLPAGVLFVTRRILKPKTLERLQRRVQDHSLEALCPGRGKKAVSHAQVNSVIPHVEWLDVMMHDREGNYCSEEQTQNIYCLEAKREGFNTWDAVDAWLQAHGVDVSKAHRIEFIKAD